MAKPRAVVDIVGAEALPYELLKEISLFIGAFCRSEARQRRTAIPVADCLETAGGKVQRLLPGGFSEVVPGIVRRDFIIPALWRVVAPDQGNGQTLGAVNIVPAETALDAETLLIGRTIAAVNLDDLVILHGKDRKSTRLNSSHVAISYA